MFGTSDKVYDDLILNDIKDEGITDPDEIEKELVKRRKALLKGAKDFMEDMIKTAKKGDI